MTERDFRQPEFRDAKVEDYEFRNDGKLVRKDRWERGIYDIALTVGFDGRSFEIEEVVQRVDVLAADEQSWTAVADCAPDEIVSQSGLFEIRLLDGSLLKGATYNARTGDFTWRAYVFPTDKVLAWREVPSASRSRSGQ